MTSPRPYRAVLLAACASAVLAGCQRKAAAPPAPPPQEVGVVTVTTHPAPIHTELPGRTEAYEIAQVRPQVSGVLRKRLFVQGADVTAGQQLYQIDPSMYQAAYDADKAAVLHAQAAALTAQAKLHRYGPLAEAHAVSRQDYDDALAAEREAEADIAQAKANLEAAATNLSYTRVYAPISGRIGRSISTVGALVTANQSANIATVTRLDPIYVDVNMPSSSLIRLQQEMASGQLQRADAHAATVGLTLEDGSAYATPGKLEFAEVNVDETTATVVVRAIFPNPDHLLLPGMFVHAEFLEGVDPKAILVPQEALARDVHGQASVMVVGADNKVSIRTVTADRAVGASWIVNQGLNDGDRVIVSGLQKVRPGAVVKPVEAAAGQDKAG
jgi:membrane fusion protein, multidrug efflux system